MPFLANWKISAAYLNWLADARVRTTPAKRLPAGFKVLEAPVMVAPVLFAAPIVIIMILRLSRWGAVIASASTAADHLVRQAPQRGVL